MKIKFLGAAGTVTGSRYFLTRGRSNLLVDCGLFQGFKQLRLMNWEKFDFEPKDLNAIVLSHAHLDHSGAIPLLVKNGFTGPIYTSAATKDLCGILLPDSGYLQEEEARFANKRGYSKHSPAMPLYTFDDANKSLRYVKALPWQESMRVDEEGQSPFEVQLFPAGHLLGAASVHVNTSESSILFSGDLSRSSDPMLRDPETPKTANYLVVESTYGNRRHPNVDSEEILKDVILKTIDRQGILLIPSFAVGRAQLILYYIHRLKKAGRVPVNLPVYLDSPMAAQANRAFASHPEELKITKSELMDIWDGVRIVKSSEESKSLNGRSESSIIIAASGMATGGRVLHHLKEIAPSENNTILFVGFQAGGTRGDLMTRGAKEVKIHGQYWPIHAEVVNMAALSARADADEILAWISKLAAKPKQVFVTHGEPEAASVLAQRIEKELRLNALVPEHGREFELDSTGP